MIEFMGILGGNIILSWLCSYGMIILSQKYQYFIDCEKSDKPQRFHTLPTPRAGGIGIFTAFICTLAILLYQSVDSEETKLYLGFLLGGSLIFLSGIAEDFHSSLSPKVRLILQCLGGGSFIVLSGLYLQDLGFEISLPSYIGIPFTLFAIVGIINAINIIDGFNGLAGGIVLLALICIFSLLPYNNPLILSLIGAVIGFLFLNFPKGKIFLGDGGAYFLGFVLASLLITITQNSSLLAVKEEGISPWFGIALLIYPFWEVIFSIYRKKFIRKISPMQPDGAHLHMLLYKRKFRSNPKTSIALLAFSFPFMLNATYFHANSGILVAQSLVFIFFYTIIYRYFVKFKF